MSDTNGYLLREVEQWRKARTSASFEILCNNVKQARAIHALLKENSHKSFVTHFGKGVSVILYLADNTNSKT